MIINESSMTKIDYKIKLNLIVIFVTTYLLRNFLLIIWLPPSLSELTSIISIMELTHLYQEASI